MVLGKLLRKALGKGDDESKKKPVTNSVSDDWNDAYKGGGDTAAVAEDGGADPSIVFENLGKTITVKKGTTILDAAIAAEVDLDHYCGGMASCGACRVQVLPESQVSEMDMMEEATLDVVIEHDDDRLGCQTSILGPVRVIIPDQD